MIEDGPAVCCTTLVLHEKCASIMLPMAFVSVRCPSFRPQVCCPEDTRSEGAIPCRSGRKEERRWQRPAIKKVQLIAKSVPFSFNSFRRDRPKSQRKTNRPHPGQGLPQRQLCDLFSFQHHSMTQNNNRVVAYSRPNFEHVSTEEDPRVSHVCNSRRATLFCCRMILVFCGKAPLCGVDPPWAVAGASVHHKCRGRNHVISPLHNCRMH